MAKTALITGISGQDGAYLAKLLLSKGYEVHGAVRRSSGNPFWRLDELGIASEIRYEDFDLCELSNIMRTLRKVRPDEIYNLAAQSFVGTSFEQPIYTGDATGLGVGRMLEAVRSETPGARFYQASTSELFGKVAEIPQRESTPFHPRSPYGVAKLYAHWITVNYRESYDMHASCGILFNHESPLRSLDFVTRRITDGLAGISLGDAGPLTLGNIDSKRDWGFAGDYVEGMWQMVQREEPGDYVLSTGRTVSVRNFVDLVSAELGMEIEWQGSGETEVGIDSKSGKTIVRVDPARYRPAEVDILVGDSSKAKRDLGWEATTSLESLASMMVAADLERRSTRG